MELHSIDFDVVARRTKEILYNYVAADSISHTPKERKIEDFYKWYISTVPYFQKHPEFCGLYDIPDDFFGRKVCWSMVRGKGNQTVVMVHHCDVVNTEDYRHLEKYAFCPDEITEKLKGYPESMSDEAIADIMSGNWLFGRGCADMKGGGSIQYALLEQYSQLDDFEGNVIVIAVPDEENYSAGMRAAVILLSELKEKYGLVYRMMINSEPHQRSNPDRAVLSEGTIGKYMPFVYVRGTLAHVGQSYNGLNPTAVLAEIISRTEVNMDFADFTEGESAPGPTWLYARDGKMLYDVSMPLTAKGCLNVLTHSQTPQQLLGHFEQLCNESFGVVIERYNESYRRYCKAVGKKYERLEWEKKVCSFKQLYEEAEAAHGEEFLEDYNRALNAIVDKMNREELTVIEGNFALIDKIYEYIEDTLPRVVYGLVPPYYPNVSNYYIEDMPPQAEGISAKLSAFCEATFGCGCDREFFYTGISDLSYVYIDDPEAMRNAIGEAMPLLGAFYRIPFEEINSINMPCINIGPWGKSLHEFTERVYLPDLYDKTPHLIDAAVGELLQ